MINGVVKFSLVHKLVILVKGYISVKSGERWRFSGVSRKIRPDLDEPNLKIMKKGLATLLRSKALITLSLRCLGYQIIVIVRALHQRWISFVGCVNSFTIVIDFNKPENHTFYGGHTQSLCFVFVDSFFFQRSKK